MIEKTIGQLAGMIDVENDISAFADQLVKGVAIDSRKISPGNLFVPFKGEHTDGHKYVEKALEQGAGAALWQEDVPNPPANAPVLIVKNTLQALQDLAASYRGELSAKVVGITGSNGKTTTKDITAAILSETYRVQKTEGNFNNHIGLPLTILSLKKTTDIAILEMGMSGKGEISLLTKIAKPDVALITNIGEAHLLDLGSRQAIAEAKLEIIEGLSEAGLFIYPGDEPLLQNHGYKRAQTFGESQANDAYPLQIAQERIGCTFTASLFPNESLFLPIAGKHNVMNTLAAMLVASEFSVPISAIKKGLNQVRLSANRMEWREGINGTTILNDAYNASPTAMRAVLRLLENIEPEREKIAILGDMLELGEEEQSFHEKIGEEIDPEKVKYVYTYGPLGKYIADGARRNFPAGRVFSFQDKAALIEAVKTAIKGKEIIVVKASRGMKMEEIVDGLALKEPSV